MAEQRRLNNLTKESELIKKAKDGTYYYRASLGFDAMTGKRIQKRRSGFKTKTAAKEDYRKLVAKADEEAYHPTSTFKEFTKTYFLPFYKNNVNEQTFRHRCGVIRRALAYFDNMQIAKITSFDVQNGQFEFLEDHSNGYTRMAHTLLGAILSRAITLGLMNNNSAKIVGNVKHQQKDIEFWTKDEFQKVIQKTSKTTYTQRLDFIILWFMFMTGMRSGEAKALTWRDIDLKAKTVNINKTLIYKSANDYEFHKTKTKDGTRVISIDQQTADFLEEWYEDQRLMVHSKFVLSLDGVPLNNSYINAIVHD